MPRKEYTSLPTNYPVCEHNDCPMATNFQRRMFPDQYRRFMEICVGEWGRNPYFERRRGARLIPISEQEFILKVLKIVGVTEEMQFDSYEQAINWYD